MDARGDQQPKTWIKSVGRTTCLAFSEDGNRLAASDEQSMRVWNASNGQELISIKGFRGQFTCLGISKDGKRVAATGRGQSVSVWDVATGEELPILRGHHGTSGIRFIVVGRL